MLGGSDMCLQTRICLLQVKVSLNADSNEIMYGLFYGEQLRRGDDRVVQGAVFRFCLKREPQSERAWGE
jgi:hypothetical protein